MRSIARPRVCVQNVRDVPHGSHIRALVEDCLDGRRDVEEPDLAVEEGVDRHLVGRVEDRWGFFTPRERREGELQARKFLSVRLFEVELPELREFQPRRRQGPPQ